MRVHHVTRLTLFATLATALCAPLLADSTLSGDLPRRADPGFRVAEQDGGLVARTVDKDSAAATAGLMEQDRITSINGHGFARASEFREALRQVAGGHEVVLGIDGRGEIRFTPPPLALEEMVGVDTHYGVVDTEDGSRLRTLVSRPADLTGKLPAVFFTQWVSCGSIEYNPRSTAQRILATLARDSGFALVRVERTSDGDSIGPACHELDYDTELSHYRQAFEQLVRRPDIDADRIVIYGSSLGSTTAPLLAQEILDRGGRVAGLIVQGGGAVTYLERMIAFDRIYLERRPEADPASIHDEMLLRIRFHTEYLVSGRSPDDIAKDSPEMAAVRADVRGLGDKVHYGRPYAWHQQAARRNFLAAWAEIDAPVLVVFNEYDQFEQRHGHRLIADVVNRLRPGTATYVEQPGIDHSNELFPSARDAYADEIGMPVPQMISQRILDWLGERFPEASRRALER